MCHGWMVIEAARAALEGKSLSDIVELVKGMISITRMIQTADTLKYLYMGGSLLNIKPLIGMEEGLIVPLGAARSRSRAYQIMVEKVEAAAGYLEKIKIAYMHAAAREEAEKINALVEERLTVVEAFIAELSPALGVHTGPGTARLTLSVQPSTPCARGSVRGAGSCRRWSWAVRSGIRPGWGPCIWPGAPCTSL